MWRQIEQGNFPFLDKAAGSGFPRDKHIVRAFVADTLRGEPPADFPSVNDIEVHRRTLVLQLQKARQFLAFSAETAHDIKRHCVSPIQQGDILQSATMITPALFLNSKI